MYVALNREQAEALRKLCANFIPQKEPAGYVNKQAIEGALIQIETAINAEKNKAK